MATITAGAVRIFPDKEALSQAAATRWAELAQAAIHSHGSFHVALSGGNTPRRLYEILAADPYRTTLPWSQTHIYFGDERAVPPDHPDSNFRMAHTALLGSVAVPGTQVHRMQADPATIDADADAYQRLLQQSLPCTADDTPQFDLILLGLGPDGHTASLFPHTPILKDRCRWVAPVFVTEKDSWRLSLTYPVLDAARHLLLLVAGADKADRLHQIFHDAAAEPVPVQGIDASGSVEWYLDQPAAEGLQ